MDDEGHLPDGQLKRLLFCLLLTTSKLPCDRAHSFIGAQLDGIELRVRRLIIYVSNTMKRNTGNCILFVFYVFIFNQRPRCIHWLHSVMTISIRQTAGSRVFIIFGGLLCLEVTFS